MSLAQRNKSRSMWVRKESYPTLFHARGWVTGFGVAGLVAAGVLVLSPLLIEPEVEHAAKVRLASLGFEVQEVKAQGQDLQVWISDGPGTKKQVLAGARALAQTTECELLGETLPCAEQVQVHLTEGFAERVGSSLGNARQEAAPAAKEAQHQPAQAPAGPQDQSAQAPAVPQGQSAQAPAVPNGEAAEPAQPSGRPVPGPAHRRCQAELSALMAKEAIRFRTASTRIVKESYKLIETLARTAASCPGYIVVVGHTDNVGKAQSNAWLSRVRAKAVQRALISRGLPADKVFAQGKGAQEPIASNDTPTGRAKNRRIEFLVVPTAPPSQESTGQ